MSVKENSTINLSQIDGKKLGMDAFKVISMYDKPAGKVVSKFTSKGGIISDIISHKAVFSTLAWDVIWVELKSMGKSIYVGIQPNDIQYFYIDRPSQRINEKSIENALKEDKESDSMFSFLHKMEKGAKIILGVGVVAVLIFLYVKNKDAIDATAKSIAKKVKK